MMELVQIKKLLEFLGPYQNQLKFLGFKGMIGANELQAEYNNWGRLITKFEHPLELKFFQPNWVPIAIDDICIFIDLKDNDMSVFEAHYFFYKPYQWFKIDIIDNISELIDNIDNEQKLKSFRQRSKKRTTDKIYQLCIENGIK